LTAAPDGRKDFDFVDRTFKKLAKISKKVVHYRSTSLPVHQLHYRSISARKPPTADVANTSEIKTL
jgi:hypothetical protein